jgi:putative ABC transport system ATP-binding protein
MPIIYRRDANIPTKERGELAHNALLSVGLVDRDEHKPTEMSGGQQQRVAIARALINSPALILADEPTGNLDSRSGLEIMEILKNLHTQGHTIVMITHDARNASFAGRVIQLKDGRINGDDNHDAVSPSDPGGGRS